MEKVKIKFIGKKRFVFSHGDVTETFAPGETKEVLPDVAEAMLKEESIERKWDKAGGLQDLKTVKIFELVSESITPVISSKVLKASKKVIANNSIPTIQPTENNTGDTQ